jgi:polysaccharide deacetylase family protein (PEP-CTERM system associated)
MLTNCFSVDVEGFAESNAQSFAIPDAFRDRRREDGEVERNMEVILALLARHNVRGTFFFLGRLARDLPAVVRATAAAGHEIGCHSYEHLRVFGVPRAEFREKLGAAKRALEDVAGRPVLGFRAPDFSITAASLWALDVLKELGFAYDSSVHPTGLHDVYGVAGAPPGIHRLPNGLLEFPPATFSLLGRRIPFAGGGYFRLFPLWLTRALMRAANARGEPVMLYIHPYEIGPELPQIPGLTALRRFRHYYHCAGGERRMAALLAAARFAPVADVLGLGMP